MQAITFSHTAYNKLIMSKGTLHLHCLPHNIIVPVIPCAKHQSPSFRKPLGIVSLSIFIRFTPDVVSQLNKQGPRKSIFWWLIELSLLILSLGLPENFEKIKCTRCKK